MDVKYKETTSYICKYKQNNNNRSKQLSLNILIQFFLLMMQWKDLFIKEWVYASIWHIYLCILNILQKIFSLKLLTNPVDVFCCLDPVGYVFQVEINIYYSLIHTIYTQCESSKCNMDGILLLFVSHIHQLV